MGIMEETRTIILELSSHRTDCSLTLSQRKLQMSPVPAIRSDLKLQLLNSRQLTFPTDRADFAPLITVCVSWLYLQNSPHLTYQFTEEV